ncbi:hypothetical protein [Polaribacter ponticola]|uniref:Uncharacterized protein n=1 Tax=Polaribacter ponticola TaxID=2978475 RepID=A0ABT5S518_9FLAO|nr:hypothetical protein [Polaribacter sp. MSW5]MDD7913188.1 hypothetical protein [Polaribacter sp. MSW5]
MNDEELADLLKYISPFEILIVNSNNELECLKCPFKVKVKYDIGVLEKDEIVLVDKVKITRELLSVYVVKNQSYYCYHFTLI